MREHIATTPRTPPRGREGASAAGQLLKRFHIPWVRHLVLLFLLLLSAMLLSGCWLRILIGNTVYEEGLSDRIDLIFAALEAETTVAICDSGALYLQAECMYIVDGVIIESTAVLVSELGFAGLIIDPLILQIPEDSSAIRATYDGSGGAKPALVSIVPSFEYVPGKRITAEPGTKFAIVELPASETAKITATDPQQGTPYRFAINFERRVSSDAPKQPLNVKAMMTARVEVNGHVYYAPMLPCVTNFADIPSMTIPEAAQPADLLKDAGNLARMGQANPCTNAFYDYSSAPPPLAPVLYLPLARRS